MFQKDVRIHGNAGTVTVEGVQLEDEGDYECNILHTNNGREETSTHELVVRIKVKRKKSVTHEVNREQNVIDKRKRKDTNLLADCGLVLISGTVGVINTPYRPPINRFVATTVVKTHK